MIKQYRKKNKNNKEYIIKRKTYEYGGVEIIYINSGKYFFVSFYALWLVWAENNFIMIFKKFLSNLNKIICSPRTLKKSSL